MKVKYENIKHINDILAIIDFDMDDMCLFIPLDLDVDTTDEFGLATVEYKADSFYGNSYVPGIVKKGGQTYLAYCPTTSIVSLNIKHYLSVTNQVLLSGKEYLIDDISKYEIGLARKTDCHISNIEFKDELK